MALSKKFLILIKVALLKGTQSPNALAHLISFMSWRIWISQDTLVNQKIDKRIPTGSPSSKYEHRRASALLRNIQNIRICMGEKTCRFCNQWKWKDFNKKQFTLLKMFVTSLLCGLRADLWPFYVSLWVFL